MNNPAAVLLTSALLLSACASRQPAPPAESQGTNARVTQAVTTPLSDLNLMKTEIPPLLQAAAAGPYAPPADSSCAALNSAVLALDELLAPDLDAPPEAKQSLTERGGDAALNALQRTAEGAVPFRGWLRKLSGAERQSRRVEAAIEAGQARRSFLKGMRAGRGC
jgi:hypothetical protein